MGYNNNYQRNNYQNQSSGRKKSGAKWSKINKGKRQGTYMINAWMRAGKNDGLFFIKCFALPKKSKYGNESANGNKKYIAEVTNTKTGETFTHTAYYTGHVEGDKKPHGGKMYIPKMNVNINPETNWCGRISNR